MSQRPVTWVCICLFAIMVILSCGGGSNTETAGGGVEGTGRYDSSAGTVSATGSITVNGVRYETDTALVIKEDNVVEEPVFAEGMVVHVDGRLNENAQTGTADQVEIITAVRGSVDAVGHNSCVIAGQTIVVDDDTVIVDAFDPSSPLSFKNVEKSNYLEISGLVTPLGTIRATRIERMAIADTDKVSGLVSAIQPVGGTFSIGALTVEYRDAVLFGFPIPAPQVGDYVEAIGILSDSLNLEASKVACRKGPPDNTIYLEVDGYSNGEADSGAYVLITPMGLVTVAVDDNTVYEGGEKDSLKNKGARMVVTGSVNNSTVSANAILFNGIVRVEAAALQADSDLGTISLDGLPALHIRCNTRTVFKERRPGENRKPQFPEVLDTIVGGEWLTIKGRLTGQGHWTATKVTIEEADKVALPVLLAPPDGPASGTAFTLQGVTVETTADTVFSDEKGAPLSRGKFLEQVNEVPIRTVGTITASNRMEADEASFEE